MQGFLAGEGSGLPHKNFVLMGSPKPLDRFRSAQPSEIGAGLPARPRRAMGDRTTGRRNNPSVTCGATSLKCPVGMHKGGFRAPRFGQTGEKAPLCKGGSARRAVGDCTGRTGVGACKSTAFSDHEIFFEKPLYKPPGNVYNKQALKHRGIAQLVEQRSPKPRAEGSSPSAPANGRVVQLVRTLACHARRRRFEPVHGRHFAVVAQ